MLSPTEALAALQSPFAAEDLGLRRTPLLAVDLRGPQEPAAEFTDRMRSTPAVIVAAVDNRTPAGPGSTASACDVVLRDDPEQPDDLHTRVDLLTACVGANPMAAVTLVQTLRLSESVDVWSALVAESLAYSTLLAGPEFRAWLRHQNPTELSAKPSAANLPPKSKVTVTRSSDRLRITLSDPSRRNAFSAAMRDQLADALRVAATDPSITEVSIDGDGPSFCAGGDLDEFGTTPDPATAHHIRMARSVAYWVHQVRAPVTFQVHGHAIGAGVELAAFGTAIVAHPDTTFALPEVSMGLIPGAGGTVSLAQRIGRQRTAWMALTGKNVDAALAQQWGLVDSIQSDYRATRR